MFGYEDRPRLYLSANAPAEWEQNESKSYRQSVNRHRTWAQNCLESQHYSFSRWGKITPEIARALNISREIAASPWRTAGWVGSVKDIPVVEIGRCWSDWGPMTFQQARADSVCWFWWLPVKSRRIMNDQIGQAGMALGELVMKSSTRHCPRGLPHAMWGVLMEEADLLLATSRNTGWTPPTPCVLNYTKTSVRSAWVPWCAEWGENRPFQWMRWTTCLRSARS